MKRERLFVQIFTGLAVLALAWNASIAQEIPDPEHRSHLGGWPGCAAVKDGHVFMNQGPYLSVMDRTGDEIVPVGGMPLPGEPTHIALHGDYLILFYQGSDSTIQVIDISDPEVPVAADRIAFYSSWQFALHVQDDLVYVATNDTLSIFDISNPLDIQQTHHVAFEAMNAICATDGLLLAANWNKLYIYDISDPAIPVLKSDSDYTSVEDIDVSGQTVYVSRTGALTLLDISDPENPNEIETVPLTYEGENVNPSFLELANQKAYVACRGSIHLFVIDVNDPTNAAVEGRYDLLKEGWIQSLVLDLPTAYLAVSSSMALLEINVSDPADPVLNRSFDAPKAFYHFVVMGDTLLAASDERLWAYKLDDPVHPTVLGSSWDWPYRSRIDANAGICYALKQDSLFIIDVSDPEHMTELGAWKSENAGEDGSLRSVSVKDSIAYLMTIDADEAHSKLEILNVSDPDHIILRGVWDLAGEGRDLFVSEDRSKAYVGVAHEDGNHVLSILNISDPDTLTELGRAEVAAEPICVWVVADTTALVGSNQEVDAYYGEWMWSLESFDVSDSDSPVKLHERGGDGAIYDVQYANEWVIASITGTLTPVAAKDAGMTVAMNPANHTIKMMRSGEVTGGMGPDFPAQLMFFNLLDLNFLGAFLVYHACLLFGLPLVALGLFLILALGGSVFIPSLSISGSYGLWLLFFLLSGGSDVHMTEVMHPDNYHLLQNYPNPFNPQTTIEFNVPRSSHVTLKVYDLKGREVATLVDESKPAGNFEVNFQAQGLASGIYLYQIKMGNHVEQKRMMIIK